MFEYLNTKTCNIFCVFNLILSYFQEWTNLKSRTDLLSRLLWSGSLPTSRLSPLVTIRRKKCSARIFTWTRLPSSAIYSSNQQALATQTRTTLLFICTLKILPASRQSSYVSIFGLRMSSAKRRQNVWVSISEDFIYIW